MKKFILLIALATMLIGQKAEAQLCFGSPSNYSGTTSPRRIISADFNGDGKPDLAVYANKDMATAINYLELAFKNRFSDFNLINKDSDLDKIRKSPQFIALINKYKKP